MFLENFKGFFSIYSYVNVQPLVVHNFNKLALILTEDASTLVTIFLTDRFQRGMIFKIFTLYCLLWKFYPPLFWPYSTHGDHGLNKLEFKQIKYTLLEDVSTKV